MKKIYASNGFQVAGKTPDEVVAKVCEKCDNSIYESDKHTPICAVKIGNNLYKGIYKARDSYGNVDIHSVTIRAYDM